MAYDNTFLKDVCRIVGHDMSEYNWLQSETPEGNLMITVSTPTCLRCGWSKLKIEK